MVIWKINGKVVGCSGVDGAHKSDAPAVRGTYKKPIRLESMGFIAEPEDVAEHRKRFPDVELEIHEGSAVPILRSLGQKRAYFKAAGLADMRSY